MNRRRGDLTAGFVAFVAIAFAHSRLLQRKRVADRTARSCKTSKLSNGIVAGMISGVTTHKRTGPAANLWYGLSTAPLSRRPRAAALPVLATSPHFSPGGEAKCMRGLSVRGARRLR